MKFQKRIIVLVLVILFVQFGQSQDFTIPADLKLESAEDYKKHEPDVLKCINWLENTPFNQNSEKRTLANAFLLQWATGTPSVTIEMHSFQMDLTKKNPDLLMSFLGGWIKHSIENPTTKTTSKLGTIAGINSLMKVYSSNTENGLKKDKRIEKLLKMDDTELENWVDRQLE